MKRATRAARVRSAGASLLLGVALGGCVLHERIHGQIPARLPRAGSSTFQAGAAKRELTPIPGIPMAGYAVAGKLSRGFWTRLYARALYLEDASGNALALVACELAQIPNGLSDRVAELLAQDPDLRHIGREQLVLAATHTHMGPSNFYSSRLYSALASPRPGFDRKLFEFLAARIVDAVRRAQESKKPALLRTNSTADEAARRHWLPGFFRNRAFRAFRLDPEAEAYLRERAPTPALPGLLPCAASVQGYPEPEACQAVHPDLDVLEIADAASGAAIGVGVFLAAHATALDPATEVYAGDVFGVASLLLEQGLLSDPGCPQPGAYPVVALFNGAEGDVSPMWVERDRVAVRSLAETLARKLCTLLPATPQPPPTIAFRFEMVEKLAGQSFDDESSRAAGYPRRVPGKPEPGAAQIGGAPDGRTIFFDLGHREELRDQARDRQGAKLAPLQAQMGAVQLNLGKAVYLSEPPPSKAPLGVYRVGGTTFVSLPGEFTTVLGERIRRDVRAAIPGTPPDRVVLIGLANGHVSYFTTPEEYDAQFYEGASTMWGAESGPFLASRIRRLAAQLPSSNAPQSRSYCYETGVKARFGFADVAQPPYWVDDGLAAIVEDPVSRFPKRDYPTFCWIDVIRDLADPGARVLPDVAIHRVVSDVAEADPHRVGTAPQDNHGLDLVTLVAGAAPGAGLVEWCAIWMVPPGVPPTQTFRFQVARVGGGSAFSKTFQPAHPPLERPSQSPLSPP